MSARAVLAVVLLVASATLAGEWTQTFAPEPTASWLPVKGRGCLVAAAGVPVKEVRKAADALADALRVGGAASLVMGDAALGELSQASDDQVLRKAAALPIATVLIVRVVPGAPGAEPSAVVTMYDLRGAPRGGFSGVRGEALAARELPPVVEKKEEPPPPVEPSPPPPREEPVETARVEPKKVERPPEPAPPPEQPEVLYARRFLHVVGDPRGERTSGDPDEVLMGAGTRPLSGGTLYTTLGRRDLAQSYGTRSTAKVLLGLGGVAAAATGGALLYLSATSSCVKMVYTSPGAVWDTCLVRSVPDLTVPALGAGAVGLGLLIWGLVLSPHPVDATELKGLIDEHNAHLRKELGVGSTPPVTVVPVVGPGGGGVALSGVF